LQVAEELKGSFGIGDASWGIDTENTVLYGSVAEWIIQSRKVCSWGLEFRE